MTDQEEIDYGPLACLIGTWEGDKGLDVAPEPDGTEENPYFETILFEAIGDVDNAETQELAVLRYHQVVSRKSNDEVFHNETGYFMWDAKAGVVMQAFSIPRGVCVLAGGKHAGPSAGQGATEIVVASKLDDPDWSIVQSPFMRENARTTAFDRKIHVEGNTLTYSETTMLEIYGRTFEHTDKNELTRKG